MYLPFKAVQWAGHALYLAQGFRAEALPVFSKNWDRVLLWDMGTGLAEADVERLAEHARRVRTCDQHAGRPLVASADSGLRSLSRHVDMLVARRTVLGTSVELRDWFTWLRERPRLARPGTPFMASLSTELDPRTARQAAGLLASHRDHTGQEQFGIDGRAHLGEVGAVAEVGGHGGEHVAAGERGAGSIELELGTIEHDGPFGSAGHRDGRREEAVVGSDHDAGPTGHLDRHRSPRRAHARVHDGEHDALVRRQVVGPLGHEQAGLAHQ